MRLESPDKNPFEQDWQNKPYSFARHSIVIDQGGNYGVQGGIAAVYIMADFQTPEIADIWQINPRDAYRQDAPQGFHYFFCDGIDKRSY